MINKDDASDILSFVSNGHIYLVELWFYSVPFSRNSFFKDNSNIPVK